MNANNVACVLVLFVSVILGTPTVANAAAKPSGIVERTITRTSTNTKVQVPAKVCTSGDQCQLNQCCLQVPGTQFATCQPLLRSGLACSWSHFTQRQPKEIVTTPTCPCFIGLICLDFPGSGKACTSLT